MHEAYNHAFHTLASTYLDKTGNLDRHKGWDHKTGGKDIIFRPYYQSSLTPLIV